MNRWTLLGVVVVGLVAGACAPGGRDCGDRFCDTRFETAASCPTDCGGATCGDRFCDAGETCSNCRGDCGACAGVCGDSFCEIAIGETCTSCARDCGACTSCGDRACQMAQGENCSTCPGDCGACTTCGDGFCRVADGEMCSNCPGDCGPCGGADPYESCGGSLGCGLASNSCTAITNRTETRSMCTAACSTDADCSRDMFDALGDCVSFGTSGGTCFHRCDNDADCYPGFGCFNANSPDALDNICLPDAGPLPAYELCWDTTSSSDCEGSLECINFRVDPSGDENVCSRSGCSTDADCPLDARAGRGACLRFGSGVSACWERCNVRADCPNMFDFDCNMMVGGSTAPVQVCVPR